MQNLYDDARAYVSSKFGGMDLSDVPADAIELAVDKLYEGGWTAYEADFRRFMATLTPAKVEVMSPIKIKAKVMHMTGRRLREHDEIVSTSFGDLEVKIVLSLATVDYRSRRDIVTNRRLMLYRFTRENDRQMWGRPDIIDIEEATDEAFYRWGALNTPERAAIQRWQAENCFRPGTERTPMRGWISRLEISHKEAHENEAFQRPIKKTTKGKASNK